MGTNYYAHKIPTKKRKLELASLINTEDFDNIVEEINKTFGKFGINFGNPSGGVIHLGKQSAGWKFLWNPNIYTIHNGHIEYEDEEHHTGGRFVPDPDTYYKLYSLTKEGIWNFINAPDIVIYDEYGEKQNKEEFFNNAINSTTWRGREAWDSKLYTEYEKEKNPYWRTFRCESNLINKLIGEGYKMISEDNSDFYSDGLRFSTSIEFS